jgi:hypothetical protein
LGQGHRCPAANTSNRRSIVVVLYSLQRVYATHNDTIKMGAIPHGRSIIRPRSRAFCIAYYHPHGRARQHDSNGSRSSSVRAPDSYRQAYPLACMCGQQLGDGKCGCGMPKPRRSRDHLTCGNWSNSQCIQREEPGITEWTASYLKLLYL